MTFTYIKSELDADSGESIHFRLGVDRSVSVSKKITETGGKHMVDYHLSFGPGASPERQLEMMIETDLDRSDKAQFDFALHALHNAVLNAMQSQKA